jgi:hypothetical protein
VISFAVFRKESKNLVSNKQFYTDKCGDMIIFGMIFDFRETEQPFATYCSKFLQLETWFANC